MKVVTGNELHDNFFNLGGHSLLAMQILMRLEKQTGVKLTTRVVLLNTLEQLAAQVPEQNSAAASSDVASEPSGKSLLGSLKRGLFG